MTYYALHWISIETIVTFRELIKIHIHFSLSAVVCVCVISVLIVFEKMFMLFNFYPHNRFIVWCVCVCVCVFQHSCPGLLHYISQCLVSSINTRVLLCLRLTSVFIPCMVSPFPLVSVGVCVCVCVRERASHVVCVCSAHLCCV